MDWNAAGENVEAGIPAVFALFLREEKKSVAFCEYGGRRTALCGLEVSGENVEVGVPAAFALFSAKRGKAWRSASMGSGRWFCVD